ncbi:MAG TPA: cation diffusion facilitator family transporter [Steroidobacteraceae bacterium]|nr:cation diffusion facilitator family transporter [Steroidobacteraceae bacterium]
MNPPSLTRFAWLSIAAAIATMLLKTVAWRLTGSVGLLSDALESLVNLAGALMALAMLSVAARPPDEDHPHGHGKAEYFSAGVEGSLIVIAAVSIAVAAVDRLLHPRALEQVGLGLGVSVVASLVNLGVALVLLRAARVHRSVTLQANAHHLLTDVWTSAGVLVGVGAVALTGWQRLDPVVALAVAANIVWTGGRIVLESVGGLMDAALPEHEIAVLRRLLGAYASQGIEYHALRTRRAGALRFVSVHVLVPPDWSVQRGHDVLEQIEGEIRRALPPVTILTHLEPLGDPLAMDDQHLHRAPDV